MKSNGHNTKIFNDVVDRINNPGRGNSKRPFVTLSYAQSLDGSISIRPTAPVRLSNSVTQVFTHRLRANHQSILIGIGTLLADDPLLNVRFASGENPQPIVVDSNLRFPLVSRLMRLNDKKPWIASTNFYDKLKAKFIEENGGKVFHLPEKDNGWVNLAVLLELLYENGIRSIMVEGGSRIITSFLNEQLADQIILTLSPVMLGGLRGFHNDRAFGIESSPEILNVQYEILENNLIIRGDITQEK